MVRVWRLPNRRTQLGSAHFPPQWEEIQWPRFLECFDWRRCSGLHAGVSQALRRLAKEIVGLAVLISN